MQPRHIIQMAHGALTIAGASFLIGGYLVGLALLLDAGSMFLETSLAIVLSIIGINVLYFMACLIVATSYRYHRYYLLRCAFAMFLNIPAAIGYMYLMLTFSTPKF